VATEQGTPGLTEEQALNIANKTLDIYNDVACDTEQTIEITFDDIANADVLVSGSASNVADWNTFFDLPTFGTPFTSVSISGNIVSLIGATNITIKNELFYFNNGSQDSVLEIVDISGVVTVLEGGAFLDCYALNYVILNGVITAGDSAFNSCNSINTLKLPLLQTAGDYCFVSIDGVPNYNFPNLVTAGTFTFAGSGVQFLLPKLVSIGNYGFNNTMPIYNIYLPSLENMGNTTGYDHVFDSIAGQNITLTIPAALMTCNGGLPDGDIQYLQANNSVTIITT
jgi:membrane-associated phospholipid phosphatase